MGISRTDLSPGEVTDGRVIEEFNCQMDAASWSASTVAGGGGGSCCVYVLFGRVTKQKQMNGDEVCKRAVYNVRVSTTLARDGPKWNVGSMGDIIETKEVAGRDMERRWTGEKRDLLILV